MTAEKEMKTLEELTFKPLFESSMFRPTKEQLKNESAQIKGLWNAIYTLEKQNNLMVRYINCLIEGKEIEK